MPKNIDIPIDVMQMILKNCEYPVVQTVQKANSILRDLVAEVSPKSSITSILIKSCKDSIQLSLTSGDPESKSLYPKGPKLNIQYQAGKKGCWVVLEKRNGKKSKKLLKGENFKAIFWQDFKILMDYHKDALLDNFEMKFEMVDITLDHNSQKEALKDHYFRFIADLRDFFSLRSKSHLIVRNVTMKTKNEQGLLFILDLLDSNYLEGIKVSSVCCLPKLRGFIGSGQPTWSNEKVRNSEHWQKAERVEVDDFEMIDFENVLHFATVKGRCLSVHMEDLSILVDSILTSNNNSHNKHYHIIGSVFFMNTIRTLYGDSHDNKWYFSTPGSDTIVELFMSPNSFQLRGMKVGDVEQGREIQDWVDEEFEDDDFDEEDDFDDEEED